MQERAEGCEVLIMDAMDAIKQRRSVRDYEPRTISGEILEDIIDAARLAPSANNIQPWEFVVITKKEALKKIASLTDYGSFIANAAACIIVCCNNTKYYLEDGSAATENALLAAKAHGVGSCWVAGDKKAYTENIKKFLDIPEDLKVVSIVSLGYAKEEPEPHQKRKLKDILHWERFSKKT